MELRVGVHTSCKAPILQRISLFLVYVRAMTSIARSEAGTQHHQIPVKLLPDILETYLGPVNVSTLCLCIDGKPTQTIPAPRIYVEYV
jgi:hypothetical protein